MSKRRHDGQLPRDCVGDVWRRAHIASGFQLGGRHIEIERIEREKLNFLSLSISLPETDQGEYSPVMLHIAA
jgi:hypothetical protein